MARYDISVICAAQVEGEEKNSNILCQKKMRTFVVRFTETMAAAIVVIDDTSLVPTLIKEHLLWYNGIPKLHCSDCL